MASRRKFLIADIWEGSVGPDVGEKWVQKLWDAGLCGYWRYDRQAGRMVQVPCDVRALMAKALVTVDGLRGLLASPKPTAAAP